MPNNTPAQKIDSLHDTAVYVAKHPGLRLATEAIFATDAQFGGYFDPEELLRREAERTVWARVAHLIDSSKKDGASDDELVVIVRNEARREFARNALRQSTSPAVNAQSQYYAGVWSAVLNQTGE